jgi:hypothetical protein
MAVTSTELFLDLIKAAFSSEILGLVFCLAVD